MYETYEKSKDFMEQHKKTSYRFFTFLDWKTQCSEDVNSPSKLICASQQQKCLSGTWKLILKCLWKNSRSFWKNSEEQFLNSIRYLRMYIKV